MAGGDMDRNHTNQSFLMFRFGNLNKRNALNQTNTDWTSILTRATLSKHFWTKYGMLQ
jgi:hypothetical protein